MTPHIKVTLLGSALSAVLAGLAPTLQAAPINAPFVLSSADGTNTIDNTNGIVEVGVDGYGNFGESTPASLLRPSTGAANLRGTPPANISPGYENTTQASFVALRIADLAGGENPFDGQMGGEAQLIGSGKLITVNVTPFTGVDDGNNTDPSPTGSTSTQTTTFSGTDFGTSDSGFNYSTQVEFSLTQTIESYANPSARDPNKVGTVLRQTYTITNNTGADFGGELLRYANFDIDFNNGGQAGGNGAGLVVKDGTQYMMTTWSNAYNAPQNNVYAGISTEISGQGSNKTVIDRYGADFAPTLNSIVLESLDDLANNVKLENFVLTGLNNGQVAATNLATAEDNYAVALREAFVIATGASITYTTTTYWGTGPVNEFNPPSGPSPSAPVVGTLPLIGLATLGLAAVGRRRKQQA